MHAEPQSSRECSRKQINLATDLHTTISDPQTGVFMSRKQQPRWNVEELTDAEISAAIRYLDPSRIISGSLKRYGMPFAILIAIRMPK